MSDLGYGNQFAEQGPPPQLRKSIAASSQWFAEVGDDAPTIAEGIYQRRLGDILQFYQSRQQVRYLGVAQNAVATASWPGVRVRYQSLQGSSLLDVVVTPENAEQSSLAIPSGNVFDIQAPFSGWPLPGWTYHVNGAVGWWTGTSYGNYYYDPAFVPAIASAANTAVSGLAAGTPLGSAWPSAAQTLTWQPAKTPTTLGGMPVAFQNQNMGGSGICTTALSGMQYWEVQVVSLPPSGSVPPTITATAPLVGQVSAFSYQDPTYYAGAPTGTNVNETFSWSWPAALDTWLSPVIGLVPQTYIDPTWRKARVTANTGVVGLDYDPTKARSIGAVRSSLIQGNWTKSWSTQSTGSLVVSGSNYLIGTFPSPTLTGAINWSVGDYVVVNQQYLCKCVVSGVGDAAGPGAGVCATAAGAMASGSVTQTLGPMTEQAYNSQPAGVVGVPPLMVVGTAQFQVVAQAGVGVLYNMSSSGSMTSVYDAMAGVQPGSAQYLQLIAENYQYTINTYKWVQTATYSKTGTVTWNPSGSQTSTSSGTKLFGDTFPAPDSPSDNTGVLLPQGANALGRHCWVFKGRADALISSMTAQPDAQPTNSSTFGVWSGVDLGDLKATDVIMIATNTTTRQVWYGKNGKWYDTNGVSQYAPGDPRLKPAVLMDGVGTGPPAQQTLYYPACSWRFGPVHLKMLFGQSQRYAQPSGFKSY